MSYCNGRECYAFDGSRQRDPQPYREEVFHGFILRGDLTHLQREHAKQTVLRFLVLLEVGWIRPIKERR